MDEDMLELRKFVAPEIIIGLDARLLINRYITHFCSSKPMIVTDKIVRKQPWFKDILNAIEEHTKNYYLFDNISSNPRDYEAMLGAELFINQECDLLIAIGGEALLIVQNVSALSQQTEGIF
jgi:alcohol dehydrogenase class IV